MDTRTDTRAGQRSVQPTEPDRRSYGIWIAVGVVVVVLIVAWLVSAQYRQGRVSPAPVETAPTTTPPGEGVAPPPGEPATDPLGP